MQKLKPIGLNLADKGIPPWWTGIFPTGMNEDPETPSASTPSCLAVRHAVSDLYCLDDFTMEKIGSGFFSDVFKVTDKTSGEIMVLKLNKKRSNRTNMLKEVQLMNKLNHPNILKLVAACVHEGQLHALTEYINGGSLDQLIQDKELDLPWISRISLASDIAQGLAYLHSKKMFHRDLTSKNILIRMPADPENLKAVIGDFGLATKIPKPEIRLPQVGSPYWMSPECLKGKYYDQRADVFSYGIIMCELIARVDADPDILPRTANFGLDYIVFSAMCRNCPTDFLQFAFNCVKIDPETRPTAEMLVTETETLLENHRKAESQNVPQPANQLEGKIVLRKVGHKRSLSEEEVVRKPPSEKARLHSRPGISVLIVAKEMSLKDPHYKPTVQNPFATLPRLREGRKIIGSTRDLFSSCFELPSPLGSGCGGSKLWPDLDCGPATKSLPGSRRMSLSDSNNYSLESSSSPNDSQRTLSKLNPAFCFEDHLFHGRVQLLKKLYSGGQWVTQDDSALNSLSASSQTSGTPLRRLGSLESGFFSTGTCDLFMESSTLSSTRSIGSSLLTVSDLEEDLRAASAFLSNGGSGPNFHKRTSSVFTDSAEDLSSCTESDDLSLLHRNGFDKDIRDIVRYFEASCRVDPSNNQKSNQSPDLDLIFGRGGASARSFQLHQEQILQKIKPEPQDQVLLHLPRSHKIDALIKRVVEKETRDRFRKVSTPNQRLQVCDGIVRSKLPIFDHTKRPARARLPFDQQGFVRSKLAIFDGPPASTVEAEALSGNAKKLAERRLMALVANSNNKMKPNDNPFLKKDV